MSIYNTRSNTGCRCKGKLNGFLILIETFRNDWNHDFLVHADWQVRSSCRSIFCIMVFTKWFKETQFDQEVSIFVSPNCALITLF